MHIRTVPVTGSTNTDLLALARDGAPEATWLRADRQTGGRGRHGRVWESPPGNLYASTLVRLRPNDPPAPTLALAAAVALHEVVTAYGAPVQIKWPNDLLSRASAKADIQHGGSAGLLPGSHQGSTLMGVLTQEHKAAKLAGILLERAEDAVVIGFGVNLAYAPAGLDRPVTSISALTGSAPDPGTLLDMLSKTVARHLAEWRGAGVPSIRARWLAAAHPLGTALSTPAGDGLFDGLDETGALRLRLADGSVRVIHAGDIFLI